MSNPSETARVSQTNIRNFALQFGWYILSRDLHAIFFRTGIDTQVSHESGMATTMAQMANFSFPYYFNIPNSEFRIPNSEICTTNFGIRNCEVYVMWANGTR